MTKTQLVVRDLARRGACFTSRGYARDIGALTLQSFWTACVHPVWMYWWITKGFMSKPAHDAPEILTTLHNFSMSGNSLRIDFALCRAVRDVYPKLPPWPLPKKRRK